MLDCEKLLRKKLIKAHLEVNNKLTQNINGLEETLQPPAQTLTLDLWANYVGVFRVLQIMVYDNPSPRSAKSVTTLKILWSPFRDVPVSIMNFWTFFANYHLVVVCEKCRKVHSRHHNVMEWRPQNYYSTPQRYTFYSHTVPVLLVFCIVYTGMVYRIGCVVTHKSIAVCMLQPLNPKRLVKLSPVASRPVKKRSAATYSIPCQTSEHPNSSTHYKM